MEIKGIHPTALTPTVRRSMFALLRSGGLSSNRFELYLDDVPCNTRNHNGIQQNPVQYMELEHEPDGSLYYSYYNKRWEPK